MQDPDSFLPESHTREREELDRKIRRVEICFMAFAYPAVVYCLGLVALIVTGVIKTNVTSNPKVFLCLIPPAVVFFLICPAGPIGNRLARYQKMRVDIYGEPDESEKKTR